MEGDFEPLTIRDRWRMMSTSFKLSCGVLLFTCFYFVLIGSLSISRCPAQPNLPYWMLIIAAMILCERIVTVPLFVKAFKEWQQKRYQQQLDDELAAQTAENAANQGLIVDPAAAQLGNDTPAVPEPPAVAVKEAEKNIPLVAKPFVMLSIVVSLFGAAFILQVFFEQPTGCSLFLLIPATMYCTVNICLLVLFVVLFFLRQCRPKTPHNPMIPPGAPGALHRH